MRRLSVFVGAICAAMVFGSAAFAQQPASPPPPPPIYGPPVTIESGQRKPLAAALAEANRPQYLCTRF